MEVCKYFCVCICVCVFVCVIVCVWFPGKQSSVVQAAGN